MQIHQIYWIKFDNEILFLSRNGDEDWGFQFYQNNNGNFQSIIEKYKLFNNRGRRITHPMSGRIYDIKSSMYKELSRELEPMAKSISD